MIGEVIAIGDELTSGQRLDTNSQWLAERLGEIGVRVMYHTTVGDELEPNVRVLREAISRADVIVVTGGLGPTADDLTREAMARAAGVDLVRDDAAVEHIRGLFARRQRPMPERNLVQALFPRGSRVIPNPHGTAPGIDINYPRDGRAPARMFALPGVPAEMKEMWAATVQPAISAMTPPESRRVIMHRRIKCFGVGESDLEAMLPDLIRRDRYPRVGITVSQATITLRITAEEATPAACLQIMSPTLNIIRDCLGELVFGEEDDELQHVIARLLAGRGQTLATSENYTGGLLATWLAETPEAHRVFRGGRLAAAEVMALADLEESARQLQRDAKTDFAVLVSTSSRALEDEAGEVHVAVCGPEKLVSRTLLTAGHPEIRRPRIAKSALDLLRKMLLQP
jgi:nicotinamide-nucleotide amidase